MQFHRSSRWALAVWFASFGAHGAEPKRTLEDGAPAAAEARYQVGLSLYQAGNYAGAALEFRGALAMFPTSLKLAYNLARTEERAGRLPEALKAYEHYLTLNPPAEERALVERLAKSLREQIEATWPEVLVTSVPAGAEIRVDAAQAPAGKTPLKLRLPPGVHVVHLASAGRVSQESSFDLKAGESKQIEVALAPAASAPPTAAPAPASAPPSLAPAVTQTPPPPAAEPAWKPWVAWSAVGLGAVGIGLGSYFLVQADGALEDAGKTDDPDRYRDLQNTYDSDRTAGFVGLGLGGVSLAAGLAVLLWPTEPAKP